MKIKINHAKLQKDKTIVGRAWREYNNVETMLKLLHINVGIEDEKNVSN